MSPRKYNNTLQGKDPLADVFEETLIKIPQTSVSSRGYQRRLAGGGFCEFFSSGALIILNCTGVFNKRKHRCTLKIFTPVTVRSIHTRSIHLFTITHYCFTNIPHRCILKPCAKTETAWCSLKKPHQCAYKTSRTRTGLNKKKLWPKICIFHFSVP